MIVLIIGLGSCGVGYASWNDTLQAKGTIEVDDCWVEFKSVQSNDPGETPDPGYDKHVASTEAKINNGYKTCWCWCFHRSNKLVVTVNNAYPSYQPTVDFWVKAYARWSCAQLQEVYINGVKINGTVVAPGEVVYQVHLYDGELVVTVNPPQSIQPCHCEQGDITIHVEQDADQCRTDCSSYKFTVKMCYEFTCCN